MFRPPRNLLGFCEKIISNAGRSSAPPRRLACQVRHATTRTGNQGTKSGSSRIPPPPRKNTTLIASLASGGVASLLVASQLRPSRSRTEKSSPDLAVATPEDNPSTYRLSEVKKHNGDSAAPWVTLGKNVYDITDWVAAHPGGEIILQAAGGSIEQYWDIFSIHKQKYVYEILEQYKIGEIDELDLIDGKVPQDSIENPFDKDPQRDPRLLTLTATPQNAETPSEGLAHFLTSNDLFYVRNHFWVPPQAASEHTLTVELPNGDEKTYTMADLRTRFRTHTITATLQCAGNRRKHMTAAVKKTNGLPWDIGAISTAEWEGVRLRDVLADAGLDLANPSTDAKHAQFSALESYGSSIPIDKALDPKGDVILAFRMNGKDLPPDHGYPLRVIAPGTVAARSVKWLKKITVADEESPAQWQTRDYKSFGPNVGDKPDWSSARAIQEMPVTSAMTNFRASRKDGPGVERGFVFEGYAYSGGGREIQRVDISLDGGRSWDQAELLEDDAKGSKAWAWRRWRYNAAKVKPGEVTVVVKATDEAYNTQPESYAGIWNARGNLANAWHRLEVDAAKGEENNEKK